MRVPAIGIGSGVFCQYNMLLEGLSMDYAMQKRIGITINQLARKGKKL